MKGIKERIKVGEIRGRENGCRIENVGQKKRETRQNGWKGTAESKKIIREGRDKGRWKELKEGKKVRIRIFKKKWNKDERGNKD
jgi:hypothetical protein